jgi:hypothetical protein
MTKNKEDKNLIVVVTKACGVVLPEVEIGSPEERRGLTLLPGQNDVSSKYWEQVKDNPGVKIYRKAGILRNDGPGVAVPMTTDISKMNIEEARVIINAIGEIERLRDIKEADKRKTIGAICDDRIEKILDENESKG